MNSSHHLLFYLNYQFYSNLDYFNCILMHSNFFHIGYFFIDKLNFVKMNPFLILDLMISFYLNHSCYLNESFYLISIDSFLRIIAFLIYSKKMRLISFRF